MNVNFGTGRKKDVIITILPRSFYEPLGGEIELEYDRISMWADANLHDVLSKVEGVLLVSVNNQMPTHYGIAVDPRYDTAHVARELEAAAVLPRDEVQTFKRVGLISTPTSFYNPQT